MGSSLNSGPLLGSLLLRVPCSTGDLKRDPKWANDSHAS